MAVDACEDSVATNVKLSLVDQKRVLDILL